MFKQLIQAKVLGTLALSLFLVCAVSSVNGIYAQQLQDDEIASPKLTPSEMAQFEAEYDQLVQEIKENQNYTESEIEVRLKYYEIVHKRVSTGYGMEDAIEAAIQPAKVYANEIKNGNQVNFIQLVQQAKQRFL